MNEDAQATPPVSRSWLDRLGQMLAGEPRNRAELIAELRSAQTNGLLSVDTLAMIEGAMAVSDKQVGDVMVPRAQMVAVDTDWDFTQVLRVVVESGHSRFPVTGEDRDEVVGILLAKDLLRCCAEGTTAQGWQQQLRAVVMIPESKRLNVLLKEFRASRNHMAVVVNEYGGVAGLITIEDVLEEIVGEIDDEHDDDEVSLIRKHPSGRATVNALTPIEDFNKHFGTQFDEDETDTIGGLVTARFGRLPIVGDSLLLSGLRLTVTRADRRRVQQLKVDPNAVG
ncbi:MAG: transporter associated domain-containing protein [Lysobacterales bacterium]